MQQHTTETDLISEPDLFDIILDIKIHAEIRIKCWKQTSMSKAHVSTASSVLTLGILSQRPKALDLNICSRQNEVPFSILVRGLV